MKPTVREKGRKGTKTGKKKREKCAPLPCGEGAKLQSQRQVKNQEAERKGTFKEKAKARSIGMR